MTLLSTRGARFKYLLLYALTQTRTLFSNKLYKLITQDLYETLTLINVLR